MVYVSAVPNGTAFVQASVNPNLQDPEYTEMTLESSQTPSRSNRSTAGKRRPTLMAEIERDQSLDTLTKARLTAMVALFDDAETRDHLRQVYHQMTRDPQDFTGVYGQFVRACKARTLKERFAARLDELAQQNPDRLKLVAILKEIDGQILQSYQVVDIVLEIEAGTMTVAVFADRYKDTIFVITSRLMAEAASNLPSKKPEPTPVRGAGIRSTNGTRLTSGTGNL